MIVKLWIVKAVVAWNVLIVVVVNDIVLVFPDDVHCTEYVQGVIDTPLHVLEVNFLSNLLTEIKFRWPVLQQSLTSQKLLYISSISLAICVPVTMGLSLTFCSTDLLRKTNFLSFFLSSPLSYS